MANNRQRLTPPEDVAANIAEQNVELLGDHPEIPRCNGRFGLSIGTPSAMD